MDRSIYEYSDLTDAEILEREKRITLERLKEIAKERNRMSKAEISIFAAACYSASRY